MRQEKCDMSSLEDVNIINMGIEAGTHASRMGVDRTTINNLISVFYGERDPVKGVLLTQVYIARQKGRREIHESVSKVLMDHINRIYNAWKGNQDALKKAMDLYLLVMKWSFESNVPQSRNIDEFVRNAIGGGG